VYAMDMRNIVKSPIRISPTSSSVDARTTHAAINVKHVALGLCKRNGSRIERIKSLNANVIIFFLDSISFSNAEQTRINHLNILLQACQCYGHSEDCEYDEEVDKKKLSIDIHGNYEGPSVCLNCDVNTFELLLCLVFAYNITKKIRPK
jgi:hypothetical protein